jgi:hypothetical protein
MGYLSNHTGLIWRVEQMPRNVAEKIAALGGQKE